MEEFVSGVTFRSDSCHLRQIAGLESTVFLRRSSWFWSFSHVTWAVDRGELIVDAMESGSVDE